MERSRSLAQMITSEKRLKASQSLTGLAPVRVEPPEVTFKDFQTDVWMQKEVTVKNLSAGLMHVRLKHPAKPQFRVQFENQEPLAPGMSLRMTVLFHSDESGPFHDSIVVMTDNYDYILSLHAYEHETKISFNEKVNLGFVEKEKPCKFRIPFENKSDASATINFEFDLGKNPEIAFDKNEMKIGARQRRDAILTYQPKENGTYRCQVGVRINGQDPVKTLDISATTLEYNFHILAPTGERVQKSKDATELPADTTEEEEEEEETYLQTSQISFGTLYHGQKSRIRAFLVNQCPQRTPFSVEIMQISNEEGEYDDLKSPKESALENMRQTMQILPAAGVLEPYGKIALDFICQAKPTDSTRGFVQYKVTPEDTDANAAEGNLGFAIDNVTDYFYQANFTFGDIDFKLQTQILARAILPSLQINTNCIDFGPSKVSDRKDYLLTIENKNDEIAVDFHVGSVPQFKVDTKRGLIQPNSTAQTNITFSPNNFGVFDQILSIFFVKGAYEVPIQVMGKCVQLGDRKQLFKGPGWNSRD